MNGVLGKAQLGAMELGVTEEAAETIVLIIENAEQQQNADEPQLTFAASLVVDAAVQQQTADGLQLTFASVLGIADGVQQQAADAPQLAFSSVLSIADGTQVQHADAVVFENPITVLIIADAVQPQLAEAPVIQGPPSGLPAMPDYCWPVDTSCCAEAWAEYDSVTKARARALAGQTMRMLTGYQVGGCPVTIRPCKPNDCYGRSWNTWALGGYGQQFQPTNLGDTWLNVSCCGANGCSCTRVCEIELPTPVGPISEIRIDGEIIDPSTYRVDNGRSLVRMGGECWPACQDMTLPAGEIGTFTVTYLNAHPVDGLGAFAAGVLACEFALACTGQACRLPRGVTQVTRQGVSVQLQPATFTNGLTGIAEVDAEILRWNPHQLKAPARIIVPGQRPVRRTTWDSGA